MRNKLVLLSGFVLILGSLSGWAEDIHLKDGTKISGKLMGVTGETLQIKTSYGDINVPKSDVVSILFPENQPKKTEAEASKEKSDASPPMDEELKGTSYTNRTAKFQVTVPKGWTIAPELRSKSVAAGLKSGDETLFFLATPEKFDGTMKTYKVLAETQFQSGFNDYKKLSESEVVLEGKTCAQMIVKAKVKNAGDAELKFLVIIIPYEGRMVRLTLMTLEPLFNDSLPMFEKIAASYKTLP